MKSQTLQIMQIFLRHVQDHGRLCCVVLLWCGVRGVCLLHCAILHTSQCNALHNLGRFYHHLWSTITYNFCNNVLQNMLFQHQLNHFHIVVSSSTLFEHNLQCHQTELQSSFLSA